MKVYSVNYKLTHTCCGQITGVDCGPNDLLFTSIKQAKQRLRKIELSIKKEYCFTEEDIISYNEDKTCLIMEFDNNEYMYWIQAHKVSEAKG